jgi:hypothetical protein
VKATHTFVARKSPAENVVSLCWRHRFYSRFFFKVLYSLEYTACGMFTL